MPGEFSLIRKYFSGHDRAAGVSLGIGDDCALLKVPAGMELAVTTDTLNEGVHFFRGEDPYCLGYKSLLVNVSDLASMGASPFCFTLSVTLPDDSPDFLEKFSKGLLEHASALKMPLIGGNTTKGPLSITISAYGLVPGGMSMRRAMGRAGDTVYVTGTLGAAGLYVAGGYHEIALSEKAMDELHKKAMLMPNRCTLATDLREYCRCAIDISDGLIGDLRHILEESHLGADIELSSLPCDETLYKYLSDEDERIRFAAYGGGDYELVFTAPSEKAAFIAELSKKHNVKITPIGKLTADGYKLYKNGRICNLKQTGFEHF